MLNSVERYELSQDPEFQGRVLMLTLRLCHKLIDSDEQNIYILTKAREIVANPETFKEKLALSIASVLELYDFDEDENMVVEDEDLESAIDDAFHAIAGVAKE
jgi:hypothetical protein